MNIFIIPSWYPTETQPLGGIFFKEQAEALAEIDSGLKVFVSLWGHSDTLLPVRRPVAALKHAFNNVFGDKREVRMRNGVCELYNPTLHWSRRLPYGGVKRLVNANRHNLRHAVKLCGKIDVIHAHVSYPAGYIASILASEFDIPFVLTEHMSPFPFPSYLKDGQPMPEIKQALNSASTTIAVSPSLASRIASFGFATPKVIPNMVDERAFTHDKPPSGRTVFFTLGFIAEQKGIDVLLKAVALWNPPAEKYEFRIGGDGHMLPEFKNMAEELGLGDRVHWLGAVNRVRAPSLFRDCHVFVLPSRHETFGVVYAEAIACGKPIIATRCGGPEFIVNELNGVLVDVGDVKGLSKALQDIGENWGKYDPNAIRADFEARFSRRAVVEQLLEVYRNVTGK